MLSVMTLPFISAMYYSTRLVIWSKIKASNCLGAVTMEQGHRRKWRLTDRSMSLWRDPDDVPYCRILSSDKTEWRFISATLCGWRRCFVDDQLWVMTCIREEDQGRHCEDYVVCENNCSSTERFFWDIFEAAVLYIQFHENDTVKDRLKVLY